MHFPNGIFGQVIGSEYQFQNLKHHHKNDVNFNKSNVMYLSTNRTGKFLFDMFFGIDKEISNAFGNLDAEDTDYEENVSLKICDCGNYSNRRKRITNLKFTFVG